MLTIFDVIQHCELMFTVCRVNIRGVELNASTGIVNVFSLKSNLILFNREDLGNREGEIYLFNICIVKDTGDSNFFATS